MKKTLTSLLTSIIVLSSYGQQIIQLKTGEKMNGRVDKAIHDTITFMFKGNKMRFAASEIGMIYFDTTLINKSEPKLLDMKPQIEDATISGVITYFFNNNYGDKPDVGATIYILDTAKFDTLNPELIMQYHYAYFYHNIAASYSSRRKPIPDDVQKSLEKFGADTEEKFQQLEKTAVNTFIKITMSKNVIKLTADGNGYYSKKLKPTKYLVLIQSKHRQSMNVMEIEGVIDYNVITLTPGEEKNLSYNFPVTEL
jgi:hypothetical protein